MAGSRVVAMCSGGADSVALVVLLARLARGVRPARIDVLHCDHGLRDAGSDLAAARAAAAHVGADLHVRVADRLDPRRGGVEAAAREWRYDVACDLATELGCDVVATGHGAHDQLEQALLSLMGVTGIAGSPATMPVARPIDDGLLLVRPLLGLDRPALEHACTAAGLAWAVDPSNLDPDAHVRNAVRHRVVPELLAACPTAGPVLARAGDRARRDADARHALADALLQEWGVASALPLRRLDAIDVAARHELVARWLLRARPGRGVTARIVSQVAALATGVGRAACSRVDLPGGACVRRDGYDLVIQPAPMPGGPLP